MKKGHFFSTVPFLTFVLSFVLFFCVSDPLLGADFVSVNNYDVSKGETLKGDVYVSTDVAIIEGKVEGDLLSIVGKEMKAKGIVGGDVAVLSRSFEFSGTAGDDIRVAATLVNIDGAVKGDVVILGKVVNIKDKSVIEGDLIIYGGSVRIEGEVRGKVRVTAQEAFIDAKVGGEVSASASSIIIGEHARLGKGLAYVSPNEAVIKSGAIITGETKRLASLEAEPWWKDILPIWFFAILIVALTIFFIFRDSAEEIAETGLSRFLPSLLKGSIIFLGVPILIALILFSFVGFLLAFLIAFIYAAFLVTSLALTGVLAGLLIRKYALRRGEGLDFLSVLLGVIALYLISLIPIAGLLIIFITSVAVLGSLANYAYRSVRLSEESDDTLDDTREIE